MPTIYHYTQAVAVTQTRYNKLIGRPGWYATSTAGNGQLSDKPMPTVDPDMDQQTAIDTLVSGLSALTSTVNGHTISIASNASAASTNAAAITGHTTTLANHTSQLGHDLSGNGSPEGVVTGVVGDSYRRLDGSIGTSRYRKQSGTGNTGWAPLLGDWQTLTYATNAATRATFPVAGVRMESYNSRAVMRGGIDISGTFNNNDPLITLPAGWRPSYTITLPGRWSGGTAIFTIDTSGILHVANGLASGNWVSLDSLSWYMA